MGTVSVWEDEKVLGRAAVVVQDGTATQLYFLPQDHAFKNG